MYLLDTGSESPYREADEEKDGERREANWTSRYLSLSRQDGGSTKLFRKLNFVTVET